MLYSIGKIDDPARRCESIYCVPWAIMAITGRKYQEVREAFWKLRKDNLPVKGAFDHEAIGVMRMLGWYTDDWFDNRIKFTLRSFPDYANAVSHFPYYLTIKGHAIAYWNDQYSDPGASPFGLPVSVEHFLEMQGDKEILSYYSFKDLRRYDYSRFQLGVTGGIL